MKRLDKNDNKRANDAYEKAQEKPCVSDDKELERMLGLSKYRYSVRSGVNRKKIKKAHYSWFWLIIFIILLFPCALLGWMFGGWVSLPEFISFFYLDYKEVLKNYNAFCLSMLVSFALMPFIIILSWRAAFDVTNVSVFFFRGIMPGITVIGLDFFWSFGSLGRSDGGRDIKTLFLINLNWDWLGAVLLNTFEMTALFFSIIAFAKYLLESDYER